MYVGSYAREVSEYQKPPSYCNRVYLRQSVLEFPKLETKQLSYYPELSSIDVGNRRIQESDSASSSYEVCRPLRMRRRAES